MDVDGKHVSYLRTVAKSDPSPRGGGIYRKSHYTSRSWRGSSTCWVSGFESAGAVEFIRDPDGVYWDITFGEDLRFEEWTDQVKLKVHQYREAPSFELRCLTAEDDRVSEVAKGYSD
jgi:hypothetical protein